MNSIVFHALQKWIAPVHHFVPILHLSFYYVWGWTITPAKATSNIRYFLHIIKNCVSTIFKIYYKAHVTYNQHFVFEAECQSQSLKRGKLSIAFLKQQVFKYKRRRFTTVRLILRHNQQRVVLLGVDDHKYHTHESRWVIALAFEGGGCPLPHTSAFFHLPLLVASPSFSPAVLINSGARI